MMKVSCSSTYLQSAPHSIRSEGSVPVSLPASQHSIIYSSKDQSIRVGDQSAHSVGWLVVQVILYLVIASLAAR